MRTFLSSPFGARRDAATSADKSLSDGMPSLPLVTFNALSEGSKSAPSISSLLRLLALEEKLPEPVS